METYTLKYILINYYYYFNGEVYRGWDDEEYIKDCLRIFFLSVVLFLFVGL